MRKFLYNVMIPLAQIAFYGFLCVGMLAVSVMLLKLAFDIVFIL